MIIHRAISSNMAGGGFPRLASGSGQRPWMSITGSWSGET